VEGSACFSDLPLPLALRIVCEALGAEGATLCAWLQLSLVCRAWRELMRPECIALALPSDDVPTAQWQALRRWVRTTSVRISVPCSWGQYHHLHACSVSRSSQPTADMQTASVASQGQNSLPLNLSEQWSRVREYSLSGITHCDYGIIISLRL